jgi:hypothetical protein
MNLLCPASVDSVPRAGSAYETTKLFAMVR